MWDVEPLVLSVGTLLVRGWSKSEYVRGATAQCMQWLGDIDKLVRTL